MSTEYSMCATHDMAEEITDDTFQICPHCAHVFLTAHDLVEVYNEVEADYAETMDLDPEPIDLAGVDSLGFCPLCGRGWG